VLLHHHEVVRDAPGSAIEFTIGAAWGTPAPQEKAP
jgi:hypothetical protein